MRALDVFVVLYRRDPEAAETLITLSQIDFIALGLDVEIYIWDNARLDPSPPRAGFLPAASRYFSSPENEPLSKVYNTLVGESNRPYVIVFDQDSSVDEEFFRQLSRSIAEVTADVFVPVIRHDGRTISPGRLRWIKGAALRQVKTNAMLPSGFTAMMSGLCISRKLLTQLEPRPFDERLWLYGVDTRFCRDLAARRGRAFLTAAELGHDSALRNTADPRATLQRQIWLWQSWLQVFDRNVLEALAIRCYVLWKVWRVSIARQSPARFVDVIAEVFR